MDKSAIKDVLYGSMTELMNNRAYFRKSTVDHRYSEWSTEGIAAVTDIVKFLTVHILKEEERVLKETAKSLTLAALRGEEV